jgi:hypothetical protein
MISSEVIKYHTRIYVANIIMLMMLHDDSGTKFYADNGEIKNVILCYISKNR